MRSSTFSHPQTSSRAPWFHIGPLVYKWGFSDIPCATNEIHEYNLNSLEFLDKTPFKFNFKLLRADYFHCALQYHVVDLYNFGVLSSLSMCNDLLHWLSCIIHVTAWYLSFKTQKFYSILERLSNLLKVTYLACSRSHLIWIGLTPQVCPFTCIWYILPKCSTQ